MRKLKDSWKILLAALTGILSLVGNAYLVLTTQDWRGQHWYYPYQEIITNSAATAAVLIAIFIYAPEVTRVLAETFLNKRFQAGKDEGIKIGAKTGRAEGRAEGVAEGRAEGIAEGRAEGVAEGRAEGIAEGRAEGVAEGRAEGIAEGRAEGVAEGRAEGVAEGRAEGQAQNRAELLKFLNEHPDATVEQIKDFLQNGPVV